MAVLACLSVMGRTHVHVKAKIWTFIWKSCYQAKYLLHTTKNSAQKLGALYWRVDDPLALKADYFNNNVSCANTKEKVGNFIAPHGSHIVSSSCMFMGLASKQASWFPPILRVLCVDDSCGNLKCGKDELGDDQKKLWEEDRICTTTYLVYGLWRQMMMMMIWAYLKWTDRN